MGSVLSLGFEGLGDLEGRLLVRRTTVKSEEDRVSIHQRAYSLLAQNDDERLTLLLQLLANTFLDALPPIQARTAHFPYQQNPPQINPTPPAMTNRGKILEFQFLSIHSKDFNVQGFGDRNRKGEEH